MMLSKNLKTEIHTIIFGVTCAIHFNCCCYWKSSYDVVSFTWYSSLVWFKAQKRMKDLFISENHLWPLFQESSCIGLTVKIFLNVFGDMCKSLMKVLIWQCYLRKWLNILLLQHPGVCETKPSATYSMFTFLISHTKFTISYPHTEYLLIPHIECLLYGFRPRTITAYLITDFRAEARNDYNCTQVFGINLQKRVINRQELKFCPWQFSNLRTNASIYSPSAMG